MKGVDLSILARGNSALIAMCATALNDDSRMVVTVSSRGVSLRCARLLLVKNCNPKDLTAEFEKALEKVRARK